ncbi:hypothetical protein QCD71_19200 [Sphingomonas sp. PsM26]|nr:hypothetical protein [Sphingomonas sp. PsM26]
MTRTSIIAAVALTLGLAACNGPNEKVGAAQDEAAANAAGVAYNGNGPAEAAGKAADHVDRAVAKARNEQADALKDQGRAISSQADAMQISSKSRRRRSVVRPRTKHARWISRPKRCASTRIYSPVGALPPSTKRQHQSFR